MRKKRIAVALSGGVDSLCALLRLVESGHEVIAIHGLFLGAPAGNSRETLNWLSKLRNICSRFSAPFFIGDFSAIFSREVIEPFFAQWLAGMTPNPCVRCNQKIKFGLLAYYARVLGADYLATGHYTSLCESPYTEDMAPLLKKTSSAKDQTYFLSLLDKKILPRLIFPLAGMEKEDCRQITRKYGLVSPQERESQDICFLPNGAKGEIIKKNRMEGNSVTGPIMLDGQQVGTHSGLYNYTIGQRRGLGIPWSSPLYVREKDFINNILHVAERDEIRMRGLEIGTPNLFVPFPLWPETIFAQWRHGGEIVECRIEKGDNYHEVKLARECFPTARGQICAFFDSRGFLLGGAHILKTLA